MLSDDQRVTRHPLTFRWPAMSMLAGTAVAAAGALGLLAVRVAGDPVGRTPLNLSSLAAIGFGLLAFAIGLGAAVLGPSFEGRSAAWRGVGSHWLVIACTILVIVLANLPPLFLALIRAPLGICSVPGFISAASGVSLALLAVTYLRFIRPGILTRRDLGLDSVCLGRRLVAGLGVGIAAIAASAILQAILDRLGLHQTQLQDFRCVREFPVGGFLLVVLAGGVVAPIAEELYFRGFVFRSYLTTRGPLVAYVASSLLFAVLHLNLPALLPIFALGILFCYAFQRTGSLVPSMVGHAVNNSLAFVILYFGESLG